MKKTSEMRVYSNAFENIPKIVKRLISKRSIRRLSRRWPSDHQMLMSELLKVRVSKARRRKIRAQGGKAGF